MRDVDNDKHLPTAVGRQRSVSGKGDQGVACGHDIYQQRALFMRCTCKVMGANVKAKPINGDAGPPGPHFALPPLAD